MMKRSRGKTQMKIVLTGGGTAGHIYPALSVASYMEQTGEENQFLYIGSKDKMEAQIVPNARIPFKGIAIQGLSRKKSLKGIKENIKTLQLLRKAKKEVRTIFQEFEPDVVFGTGGYVSAPVMMEAQKMGIPTVLHESNALPGVAAKKIAKKATTVLVAEASSIPKIESKGKVVATGIPVNPEFFTLNREAVRKKLALSDKDVLILSFGGSLGALKINEMMALTMATTLAVPYVRHIHATGSFYVEDFPEMLKEAGVTPELAKGKLHVSEYIDNMPECLTAADIVIARSGATTVNELKAVGRASILIPSPNVAENHQYYNAMELGDVGAAVVIEEKDLTAEKLLEVQKELVENPGEREVMAESAHALFIQDANARIVEEIQRAAK